MLSVAENPPITWPELETLAGIDSPWTVVYTKPRQEKALAWEFCQKEISYFLPMVLRETSSGGRRRRNLYPLFPSYIFFAGPEEARLEVLKTQRTVSTINIRESQQAQFRSEITALHTALRCNPSSIELHPRVVPGAKVTIKSGPMKDVEGVVLQAGNKKKLWLGVSVLGVGATVEIPADLVEVR